MYFSIGQFLRSRIVHKLFSPDGQSSISFTFLSRPVVRFLSTFPLDDFRADVPFPLRNYVSKLVADTDRLRRRFGPIGVSAVYYAMVALKKLPQSRTHLRETIVPVVLFITFASTFAHVRPSFIWHIRYSSHEAEGMDWDNELRSISGNRASAFQSPNSDHTSSPALNRQSTERPRKLIKHSDDYGLKQLLLPIFPDQSYQKDSISVRSVYARPSRMQRMRRGAREGEGRG